MPTGYTHKIYAGESQTFPEFAKECARAFGALITLRDSPNAEIPERFEPDSYHKEKLEQAHENLTRWEAMSDDEVAADLRRTQDEAFEYRQNIIDTATEREERYRAMLDKVEAWTPPTEEHQGLKDFMIQQLSESITWDCSTTYLPMPPPDDVAAWRRNRIEHYLKEVDYHDEKYDEECERAEGRTAWIQALWKSLDTSDG